MSIATRIVRKVRRLVGIKPSHDAAGGRDLALKNEIDFWREWFQTKGREWPDDYAARFDPNLPLQEKYKAYVDQLPDAEIDILDVGAGPLTKLGKKHPTKLLRITPTDYLAPQYNQLIDEVGAQPLIRSQFADGEKLVEQFGPNRFHMTIAQNCVDHMADPARAIEQIIAVTRPGGWAVLLHEEYEGRRVNYATLHQWDFYHDDPTGHFHIREKGKSPIDITEKTKPQGTSKCHRDDNLVVFALRKNG